MIAYVVEVMGGYLSGLEGRVRSLSNAQLFSSKVMAQDTINTDWKEWEDTCAIIEVEVLERSN